MPDLNWILEKVNGVDPDSKLGREFAAYMESLNNRMGFDGPNDPARNIKFILSANPNETAHIYIDMKPPVVVFSANQLSRMPKAEMVMAVIAHERGHLLYPPGEKNSVLEETSADAHALKLLARAKAPISAYSQYKEQRNERFDIYFDATDIHLGNETRMPALREATAALKESVGLAPGQDYPSLGEHPFISTVNQLDGRSRLQKFLDQHGWNDSVNNTRKKIDLLNDIIAGKYPELLEGDSYSKYPALNADDLKAAIEDASFKFRLSDQSTLNDFGRLIDAAAVAGDRKVMQTLIQKFQETTDSNRLPGKIGELINAHQDFINAKTATDIAQHAERFVQAATEFSKLNINQSSVLQIQQLTSLLDAKFPLPSMESVQQLLRQRAGNVTGPTDVQLRLPWDTHVQAAIGNGTNEHVVRALQLIGIDQTIDPRLPIKTADPLIKELIKFDYYKINPFSVINPEATSALQRFTISPNGEIIGVKAAQTLDIKGLNEADARAVEAKFHEQRNYNERLLIAQTNWADLELTRTADYPKSSARNAIINGLNAPLPDELGLRPAGTDLAAHEHRKKTIATNLGHFLDQHLDLFIPSPSPSGDHKTAPLAESLLHHLKTKAATDPAYAEVLRNFATKIAPQLLRASTDAIYHKVPHEHPLVQLAFDNSLWTPHNDPKLTAFENSTRLSILSDSNLIFENSGLFTSTRNVIPIGDVGYNVAPHSTHPNSPYLTMADHIRSKAHDHSSLQFDARGFVIFPDKYGNGFRSNLQNQSRALLNAVVLPTLRSTPSHEQGAVQLAALYQQHTAIDYILSDNVNNAYRERLTEIATRHATSTNVGQTLRDYLYLQQSGILSRYTDLRNTIEGQLATQIKAVADPEHRARLSAQVMNPQWLPSPLDPAKTLDYIPHFSEPTLRDATAQAYVDQQIKLLEREFGHGGRDHGAHDYRARVEGLLSDILNSTTNLGQTKAQTYDRLTAYSIISKLATQAEFQRGLSDHTKQTLARVGGTGLGAFDGGIKSAETLLHSINSSNDHALRWMMVDYIRNVNAPEQPVDRNSVRSADMMRNIQKFDTLAAGIAKHMGNQIQKIQDLGSMSFVSALQVRYNEAALKELIKQSLIDVRLSFWSMPHEARAGLLNRLMYPSTSTNSMRDPQLHSATRDAVLDRVFSLEGVAAGSEQAQKIKMGRDFVETFLRIKGAGTKDAFERFASERIYIGMIAAAAEQSAGHINLGKMLKTALSGYGPLGDIISQNLANDLRVPEDVRSELKEKMYKASPLERWDVIALLDKHGPQILRDHPEVLKRIGAVPGSGSKAVTVNLELADGRRVSTNLLREYIRERMTADAEHLRQVAIEFSRLHPEMKPLVDIISQVQQRITPETTMPVAEHQNRVAQSVYDPVTMKVTDPATGRVDNFNFKTAEWVEHNTTSKTTQTVGGENLARLSTATPQDAAYQRNFARAMAAMILRNRVSGNPTDGDRHLGQQNIDGQHIGLYDHGGLPLKPPTAQQIALEGQIMGEVIWKSQNPIVGQDFITTLDQTISEYAKKHSGHTEYLTEMRMSLLKLGNYAEIIPPAELKGILANAIVEHGHPSYIEGIYKGVQSASTPPSRSWLTSIGRSVRSSVAPVFVRTELAKLSATSPVQIAVDTKLQAELTRAAHESAPPKSRPITVPDAAPAIEPVRPVQPETGNRALRPVSNTDAQITTETPPPVETKPAQEPSKPVADDPHKKPGATGQSRANGAAGFVLGIKGLTDELLKPDSHYNKAKGTWHTAVETTNLVVQAGFTVQGMLEMAKKSVPNLKLFGKVIPGVGAALGFTEAAAGAATGDAERFASGVGSGSFAILGGTVGFALGGPPGAFIGTIVGGILGSDVGRTIYQGGVKVASEISQGNYLAAGAEALKTTAKIIPSAVGSVIAGAADIGGWLTKAAGYALHGASKVAGLMNTTAGQTIQSAATIVHGTGETIEHAGLAAQATISTTVDAAITALPGQAKAAYAATLTQTPPQITIAKLPTADQVMPTHNRGTSSHARSVALPTKATTDTYVAALVQQKTEQDKTKPAKNKPDDKAVTETTTKPVATANDAAEDKTKKETAAKKKQQFHSQVV